MLSTTNKCKRTVNNLQPAPFYLDDPFWISFDDGVDFGDCCQQDEYCACYDEPDDWCPCYDGDECAIHIGY